MADNEKLGIAPFMRQHLILPTFRALRGTAAYMTTHMDDENRKEIHKVSTVILASQMQNKRLKPVCVGSPCRQLTAKTA